VCVRERNKNKKLIGNQFLLFNKASFQEEKECTVAGLVLSEVEKVELTVKKTTKKGPGSLVRSMWARALNYSLRSGLLERTQQ